MEHARDIKDYLQHRLEPDAKEAFERKLAEDPDLRQELSIQRDVQALVEADIAKETRARVRAAIAEVPLRKRPRGLLWGLIGMTVILLTGAVLQRQIHALHDQGLYEYAYVEPADFAVRGTVEESIQAILAAESQGDVKSMTEHINLLPQAYERRSEMLLLLAKTRWNKGNEQAAEALYLEAMQDPTYVDLAKLQTLYFYAKTKQIEKYDDLRATIQDIDAYTFSEELTQLEANRKHALYKHFY